MTTAAIASFFRPLLLLLLFAAIVIPIKLLVLRLSPPTLRAILNRPLEPWRMWTIWTVCCVGIITWFSTR